LQNCWEHYDTNLGCMIAKEVLQDCSKSI
jgi:hypothetical protein